MKKLLLVLITVWFLVPLAQADKLEIAIFTRPSCVHCQKLKREYLKTLKKDFKNEVNFVEFDVSKPADSMIFYDTMREYNETQMGVPAMVVGNTVLMGYPQDIKTEGPAAILSALKNKEKTLYGTTEQIAECKASMKQEQEETCQDDSTKTFNRKDAQTMFEKITFWAIIAAGLIDGINPCAFAVIVFFISFLSVYKYTRKEILLVGSAYCGSVFVAYILIGLGLFNFLYAMSSFYYVMEGFKWFTIILCAIFLIISVYDFLVYQITKNSGKVILQLDKNYKERIHNVIRYFLRDKNKSAIRLFFAAVVVGFIVSLVEAVCTGQVYLPTIAVILKEADKNFFHAMIYLLTYNLMFIVPLVIIFVLSLLGYESKGFNEFLKKNLGLTKLALCLLFLGLLVLLLTNF